MKIINLPFNTYFAILLCIAAQLLSFRRFVNPVIPEDRPNPTLTKIKNDFYTSGSSFNPTPKVYH